MNTIYSFNINLLVSPEQENVNYRTSRITLEFIFSIQALQPTFTWKTSTPTNPGRWLVFDNAKVQIYGEGYSTGDYTTNPTDSVTMSGGSIYRKVTINN